MFLSGRGALNDQDYNAVAAALNDRLIAAGAGPSLPYSDDDR